MKKGKLLLGLGASLLMVSLVVTGCGKEVNISSKAAVGVKGGEITANDFYKEIKTDNISKLVDLIDHKVLDKKYPKTDKEDENVKEQIDQIKSYYGDNEEQFKKVIEQYFGVETEKELETILRLEYKRGEAVNDYIEEHLSKSEIKKYYNDNIYGKMSAKHILITPDVKEDATEEEKEEAKKVAKETAEKVIAKLNEGKKFDSLAKKYSQDESNKNNGGDLGEFEYADMVEEFSEACVKLGVDEYTKEPVETQYGYHVILKTAQKDKPKQSKVEDEIKETLRTKKLEEDKTLYYVTLDKVRKAKKITWNDSKLEKAYNDYMDKLIEAQKSDN